MRYQCRWPEVVKRETFDGKSGELIDEFYTNRGRGLDYGMSPSTCCLHICPISEEVEMMCQVHATFHDGGAGMDLFIT